MEGFLGLEKGDKVIWGSSPAPQEARVISMASFQEAYSGDCDVIFIAVPSGKAKAAVDYIQERMARFDGPVQEGSDDGD